MKRKGGSPLGLYTLGIAALFWAGLLLLVMFGARTYQAVAAGQEGNNNSRALLSYLAACVKGGDSAGNVRIRDSETGPELVVEDGSGYAVRIYRYKGYLMEEYSAVDAPLAPDEASALGKTSVFTAEFIEPGVMEIRTDAGEALLSLRTWEGSE